MSDKKQVFVYGSLLSPLVMRLVIGALPKNARVAALYNFGRRRVRAQPFPAITPHKATSSETSCPSQPHQPIIGLVVEVNVKEMQLLDAFEDVDEGGYIRATVNLEGHAISTEADDDIDFIREWEDEGCSIIDVTRNNEETSSFTAQAYIFNADSGVFELEREQWTYAAFRSDIQTFTNYIEMCKEWCDIDENNANEANSTS